MKSVIFNKARCNLHISVFLRNFNNPCTICDKSVKRKYDSHK